MAFFLLTEVAESGGGSAMALETLSGFMNEVSQLKKETKSSMRIYEVLSIMTPIAMAVTVAMIVSMLTSFPNAFASPLAPGSGAIGGFSAGAVTQAMLATGDLLIVVSSICIALIGGKAIDFTTKSTLRIAINIAVAVVAISLSGVIAKQFASGLGSGIP